MTLLTFLKFNNTDVSGTAPTLVVITVFHVAVHEYSNIFFLGGGPKTGRRWVASKPSVSRGCSPWQYA